MSSENFEFNMGDWEVDAITSMEDGLITIPLGSVANFDSAYAKLESITGSEFFAPEKLEGVISQLMEIPLHDIMIIPDAKEISSQTIDSRYRKDDGQTLLMEAAGRNNLPLVTALIAYKADVDLRNKNGVNALQIARDKGHTALAQIIIQAGIDGQKNKDSKVALPSVPVQPVVESEVSPVTAPSATTEESSVAQDDKQYSSESHQTVRDQKENSKEQNLKKGMVCFKLDRFEEALAFLDKAIEGEGQSESFAYYYRARCYLQLGQLEKAKQDWMLCRNDAVIRAQPKYKDLVADLKKGAPRSIALAATSHIPSPEFLQKKKELFELIVELGIHPDEQGNASVCFPETNLLDGIIEKHKTAEAVQDQLRRCVLVAIELRSLSADANETSKITEILAHIYSWQAIVAATRQKNNMDFAETSYLCAVYSAEKENIFIKGFEAIALALQAAELPSIKIYSVLLKVQEKPGLLEMGFANANQVKELFDEIRNRIAQFEVCNQNNKTVKKYAGFQLLMRFRASLDNPLYRNYKKQLAESINDAIHEVLGKCGECFSAYARKDNDRVKADYFLAMQILEDMANCLLLFNTAERHQIQEILLDGFYRDVESPQDVAHKKAMLLMLGGLYDIVQYIQDEHSEYIPSDLIEKLREFWERHVDEEVLLIGIIAKKGDLREYAQRLLYEYYMSMATDNQNTDLTRRQSYADKAKSILPKLYKDKDIYGIALAGFYLQPVSGKQDIDKAVSCLNKVMEGATVRLWDGRRAWPSILEEMIQRVADEALQAKDPEAYAKLLHAGIKFLCHTQSQEKAEHIASLAEKLIKHYTLPQYRDLAKAREVLESITVVLEYANFNSDSFSNLQQEVAALEKVAAEERQLAEAKREKLAEAEAAALPKEQEMPGSKKKKRRAKSDKPVLRQLHEGRLKGKQKKDAKQNDPPPPERDEEAASFSFPVSFPIFIPGEPQQTAATLPKAAATKVFRPKETKLASPPVIAPADEPSIAAAEVQQQPIALLDQKEINPKERIATEALLSRDKAWLIALINDLSQEGIEVEIMGGAVLNYIYHVEGIPCDNPVNDIDFSCKLITPRQKLAFLRIIQKHQGDNFVVQEQYSKEAGSYCFRKLKSNIGTMSFDFSGKKFFDTPHKADPISITEHLRLKFNDAGVLTLVDPDNLRVKEALQQLRDKNLEVDQFKVNGNVREIFRRVFVLHHLKGFSQLGFNAKFVLSDSTWQEGYLDKLYCLPRNQMMPSFLNPVYLEMASFLKKEYKSVSGKRETCFSHPRAAMIIESALRVILKRQMGITSLIELQSLSANVTKVLQDFYREKNAEPDYKQFYSIVHCVISNIQHIHINEPLSAAEISTQVELLWQREEFTRVVDPLLRSQSQSPLDSKLSYEQRAQFRPENQRAPWMAHQRVLRPVRSLVFAASSHDSPAGFRSVEEEAAAHLRRLLLPASAARGDFGGVSSEGMLPAQSVLAADSKTSAVRDTGSSRVQLTADTVRILRRPSPAEMLPEVTSSSSSPAVEAAPQTSSSASVKRLVGILKKPPVVGAAPSATSLSSLAVPCPVKKVSFADSPSFFTEARAHAQVATARSAGRDTVREGGVSSTAPSPVRHEG